MSNEEKRPLFNRSNELPNWGSIRDIGVVSTENEYKKKTTNVTEHSDRSMLLQNASDKLSTHRNGFQISVGTKECKHFDYVNAVCTTSDGKFIASASDDRTILLWKMKNGKIEFERKLEGHTDVIVSLFALPNNQEILSGSYDCTIKQWDLLTGKIMLDIKDGDKTSQCLAVYYVKGDGYEYIVRGARSSDRSEIGVIQIYDTTSGNLLLKLNDHANYVRCFAATSFIYQRYLFSGSLDKTITRWDLNTCHEEIFESTGEIRTLSCKSMLLPQDAEGRKLPVKLRGHSDWVRSICITNDDLRLVSCSNDKTIRIWDVHSTECIQILRGHTDGVRSVCISDDGSQIISGSEDMTVRLWDLQTGSPIRILRGHENWITCVCTLPGTRQILSASTDKCIKLWDVYATPLLQSFDHGTSTPVLCVCGELESTIFTCTKDTLYVWDEDQHGCSALEPKATWNILDETGKKEIACMCMINNDTVATGSNICGQSEYQFCDHSEHMFSVIEIWQFRNDIIEKNAVLNFRKMKKHLTCLYYCDPIIISGFKNKTITIVYLDDSFDAKEYDCSAVDICSLTVPLSISCIQYDEYYLIITGCENKDILIWKYFVLGKHTHSINATASINMIHMWALKGHIYSVRCLTYSADRRYIVSGSEDYTIKMWAIPSSIPLKESAVTPARLIKPHHSFEGHTRSVSSVCCTEDYLISSSADKTIMVWCLKQLCLLRTLIGHTDEVIKIYITQSNRLLSASKDGTMRLWDLSVGRNVPSDEELRELIRVRHEEYGFSPQVTKVIELMTSANVANKPSIPLDAVKRILRIAGKEIISSQRDATDKEVEEAIEDIMKQLLKLKTPVASSPYELGGMMKTFEVTVRAGAESTKLLPLGHEDGVQVPLVHWMSRIPEYRDFMLTKILPNHPELLYSESHCGNSNTVVESKVGVEKCDCHTLLRKALQSKDPDFIFRALDVLSTFVKTDSQEMMWHAHNSVVTMEKDTLLLLDIEDVALAFEEFWDVNNVLKNDIMELQRAPQSIQDSLSKLLNGDDDSRKKGDDSTKFLNIWVWDGDGEEDRIKVEGCVNVFSHNNWVMIAERTLLAREYLSARYHSLLNLFYKPRHPELMEASYVPFPMRKCRRSGNWSKHSSTLLLEVCVDGAQKANDSSVFQSTVLTSLLVYKLRRFGWGVFTVQCIFSFSLIIHFAIYSIFFSKQYDNWMILWALLLSMHFIIVIILEYFPFFINSSSASSYPVFVTFIFMVSCIIFFVMSYSYAYHGSELDKIMSTVIYFWMFACLFNNLKTLPSFLFIRIILRVMYEMRSYVIILILFALGFALMFRTLMSETLRSYHDKMCDTDPSYAEASECDDMKETTERFDSPVISWVSMYMTLMGVIDWDSTSFNMVPSSPTFYALIILICVFVFMSNVILNITISVMNEVYDDVKNHGHAGYHLIQASYVLRVEKLLLFFGLINLNEKYFPKWIVALSPKRINRTRELKQDKDK